MRGIILAGGSGTRLRPMTLVTNKHLLNVYNLPIIYFPLRTLKSFDITEIMIITGKEHAGAFIDLLGSGTQFEVNFTYRVQDKAGGIAEALRLCKDFSNKETIAVILGDNIFDKNIKIGDYSDGAKIFLKSVSDPERFGVATVENKRITKIVEKPDNPESNLAVTGLYIYDQKVWEIIDNLEPSARGELEISDVNNWYIKKGLMRYQTFHGFWQDCGTPESLLKASNYIKQKENELKNY